jgi:hypothetical protein
MPPRKSMAITPQDLTPPANENLPAAPFSEQITQIVVAAGIDPVTTTGMQEVRIIQEVFGKHHSDLEALIPACQAVDENDHVTAKTLSLKLMRIRTAAEKNRLALNKDSRSRIAAVDGANKLLLHPLTQLEDHMNGIVAREEEKEREAIRARGEARAAHIRLVGNPEGYELETMSEELFQRLLARLTKEHDDAKEAAAKQTEANRIAAEAAAKLAEEKAKVEAEAQRLRQIVLDNERKEREAQAAHEAKEAAAKMAEVKRRCDEEKRVERLRGGLTKLASLSKTVLGQHWQMQVNEITGRLAEAEATDWAEFDMEAEGYIAITREWLAVAVPAAQAAEEAKAKALEEAEAKRKAELAPDVEKLTAIGSGIESMVTAFSERRAFLKSSASRETVAVLCSKLAYLKQEFENNIALLSIGIH